jgi:hypothetical protein
MYYDDEGLCKYLPINHVANAMLDCGRFTSKKFDYVDEKSYNQQLKDAWGAFKRVGDIICKIRTGTPIPDCSIFGDNPVSWIHSHKKPNARMIAKIGDESKAYDMCDSLIYHPCKVVNGMFDGSTERKVSIYSVGVEDKIFGEWWCAEWMLTLKHIIPKLIKEIDSESSDIEMNDEIADTHNWRFVLGTSSLAIITTDVSLRIDIGAWMGESNKFGHDWYKSDCWK